MGVECRTPSIFAGDGELDEALLVAEELLDAPHALRRRRDAHGDGLPVDLRHLVVYDEQLRGLCRPSCHAWRVSPDFENRFGWRELVFSSSNTRRRKSERKGRDGMKRGFCLW